MDIKKPKRWRCEPLDANGYEEIIVAMIGNVDAGKSSTIGTLLTGVNDDGKGSARSVVFIHPHEHQSGRTSDLSHQYMKDEESKRIVSFIDLPGHEMYLKTTIAGLTAIMPDFAFVCISDKITKMTIEHLRICNALKIQIVILFTKTDVMPPAVSDSLVKSLKEKFFRSGTKVYRFRNIKDFAIMNNDINSIVPYFLTSNKTGEGMFLVKHALRTLKAQRKFLPTKFIVDHVYTVPGHGVVLSGVSGYDISIGDQLYMGPFDKGDFVIVNVKSIHNDYRHDINTLTAGKRGCIAIGMKAKEKYKYKMHAGLILSKDRPKDICSEFVAEVSIVHHSTTISLGYTAFINCGNLHVPAIFTKITDLNDNVIDVVRSGAKVRVTMKFQKNLNYVPVGQKIIFREGTIRGFGYVTQTI